MEFIGKWRPNLTLLMISACKENEEYEEYEEFQILVNAKKENLRKNIYRGERERYSSNSSNSLSQHL